MEGRRGFGPKNLKDEDIIQDMRLTAITAPHGALTERFYRAHGRYSAVTVTYHFGSWTEGMKKAFPDLMARRTPTPEAMIADLNRVADVCRKSSRPIHRKVRTLTRDFYAQYGEWGSAQLLHHLAEAHLKVKGWKAMKVAIGITDV